MLKIEAKIGDIVLIGEHEPYEATVLNMLVGIDAGSLRTFYKIRKKGPFGRTKWLSEYYINGILPNE